jgi:acetyl esterase
MLEAGSTFASLFRPEAIDPQTRDFNERLGKERNGAPQLEVLGAVPMRELRHKLALATPGIPSSMAVEREIPGPTRPVAARVFVPESVSGVYLHLHGGGFAQGEALASDARNEATARSCGLAVVSIDYRLAPEDPYPAGPDDCEAVALWLIHHARTEFGTERLLIGGESAGASLAVTTLIRLRDHHGFRGFSAANLVYGWYDVAGTPSVTVLGPQSPTLSPTTLAWYSHHYLSNTARWHEPDVSPLYADVTGLPPALFTVGTHDLLLDDTLFMYPRWLAAGNQAELAVFPGAPHGFFAHGSAVAKKARARTDAFLGAIAGR